MRKKLSRTGIKLKFLIYKKKIKSMFDEWEYISQLVVETFIPNPKNKTIICHINITLNILVLRRVLKRTIKFDKSRRNNTRNVTVETKFHMKCKPS